MKISSLNNRSIAIIVIFTFIIVFACVVLFSLANPKYNAVATQTRAERTSIAYTVTNSYLQTQSALPTNTPTLTPSPIPTNTQIPTPLPVLSTCDAKILNSANLFAVPSTAGKVLLAFSPNAKIRVMGKTEGFDWYLASTMNDTVGWVETSSIKIENTNCEITNAELPFLMGINNAVFSETFYGKYRWVDENGSPIQVLRQALVFNAEGTQKQAIVREQPFGWLETFNLYTSYVWGPNYDYGGVRFWDDGKNYYEIRIRNSCQIELIENGVSLEPPRDINNNTVLCYSDKINYLHIWVDEQRYLRIQLNEVGEPILFTLPTIYQGSGIKFVAQNSSMNIQFVVISQ
ncbi:MAG: hypothetical protein HOP27_00215 [Anaerolineales bacterium]|nr:hypothetical protein [Anaerolineales bacterium]